MVINTGNKDPFEEFLLTKAQQNTIPINGVFELTPLCNLNCKMCYIRLSYEEMKAQGNMISCDEWLKIAKSALDGGTLYLLLTGGEPLIYPEFKRLYKELSQMGFVITINTNGLLITEEIAQLFSDFPIRRVNLTLYGSNNETYEKLCNDPTGFTKVTQSIKLLKKYNIPFRFNYTVTPFNHQCHDDIYALAKELNVYVAQSTYIFPPTRRDRNLLFRLPPKEAAELILKGNFYNKNITTEALLKQSALTSLQETDKPLRNYAAGYRCSAGHREYFVNWKGEMFPCGVFGEPRISLLEHSFNECWEFLVEEVRKLENNSCNACENCPKRNICHTCLASRYCETGSFSGKPEYLCQMVDEEIKLLLPYLDEQTRIQYEHLLEQPSNQGNPATNDTNNIGY